MSASKKLCGYLIGRDDSGKQTECGAPAVAQVRTSGSMWLPLCDRCASTVRKATRGKCNIIEIPEALR